MPSDQDDLSAAQAFREARDAATPNWCNHYYRRRVFRNLRKWPEVSRGDLIAEFESFADADFAIAARNSDLPERVERLVREVSRLRNTLSITNLALSCIAKDNRLECRCGTHLYDDGEECPRCFASRAMQQITDVRQEQPQ